MKYIFLLLLVILTLIIIFMDHEQLKLFGYLIQPFNSVKPVPVPFKKRKIAIITAEDRDFPFIQYHDINFKKYSDIHEYSYFRLDNCPKEVSSTYWCKIHRVKEFLDSGKYDYVMWADSDTIIPDLNKSLDQFISNSGEPDIIMSKYQSILPLDSTFCAGLFLVKNSDIGKSFINDCLAKIKSKSECIINGKEQGMWGGVCYEEGVMNLLIREKYKDYTFIDNKYLLNLPYLFGRKFNNKDSPIVVHLAGYPNDIREEFFKQYI